MIYDYNKRGYLLPDGCNDLIAVLTSKTPVKPLTTFPSTKPLPPIAGEVTVAERMTIRELAALLKQKPFQIIAELIELKILAKMDQELSFDLIAQLVRRYGYTAKREA